MIKTIGKHWGLLTGIGIVVSYLALLVLLTVTDSSRQYKQSAELLHYSDFTVTAGEADINIRDDAFAFIGGGAGDKVCAAELSLVGMERLQVQFSINCLEANAGAKVHVDLCAEGYDNDEQEHVAMLQAGDNTISCTLEPTADAPETVQLRIFTLDPAGYDVKNLRVTNLVAVDHSVGIIISSAIMGVGLLLCAVALLCGQPWKKSDKR